MTISSWPRLVIGTLTLMVSAATGMLAWSVETCAGDSAGSLWMGAVTLAANILAWALLGTRVPSKLVLLVAVLPALAALSYSLSTIQLASGYLLDGLGACAVMKPGQDFGADGREPVLAHEVAHGCTRTDATKDFVVFQAKHLETSRA